jgi:hypothetical protein
MGITINVKDLDELNRCLIGCLISEEFEQHSTAMAVMDDIYTSIHCVIKEFVESFEKKSDDVKI